MGVGLGFVLLVLSLGTASASTSPEGPRLAFIKWGPKPNEMELLSVGFATPGRQRISGGSKAVRDHSPVPFNHATWSPEGTSIAFAAYFRPKKTEIFIAEPDGNGLHSVPGTVGGQDPVFAPDGHTIAFARSRYRQPHFDLHHPLESLGGGYSSTTTWTIGANGEGAKRLTSWRNGLYNTPSSFSPDGATLALSREGRGSHSAVLMDVSSGRVTLLARHAEEPAYSPDGSRIAFVSYRDRNIDPEGGFDSPMLVSELYVENVDGSGLTRITHTQERQENAPSWDPSGARLAYTQASRHELFGLGLTNVVMEINADGTCPTRVFGKPAKPRDQNFVGLYGPAWQLGPGREAGPIAC
ncbi:MAG: TolB family protein [Solirubrobacterales bacterium]